MDTLSKILLDTVKELQQLPSLANATLGGGTNLALRFKHRLSDDIDLFFPDIIGLKGYEEILKDVRQLYGGKIFGAGYPTDYDDQIRFQRVYIRQRNINVKVEILQNMHTYDPPIMENGVRFMSERDIGMLKLMAAGNRGNNKDIYDLDYITDRIPLNLLMRDLKIKLETFNLPEHRSVFDVEYEGNPVDNPLSLLKFENPSKYKESKPGHSSLRIDILPGGKNWISARSSWRMKVRAYFRENSLEFPGISNMGSVANQRPFEPDNVIEEGNDEDISQGYTR